MSGWFSKMFGNKLWRTVYHKIPDNQRENIRKTVDAADRVFDQEHAKETGIQQVPDKQYPMKSPAEVNKEFARKADRVRRNYGNPNNR